MKTKRILALMLTVLTVFSAAGCGSKKEDVTPEAVVTSYFEALKKSDFKTSAQYVNSEPEEFQDADLDESSKAFIDSLMANLSYTIISSTESEDSAVVVAKVKNVSMSDVMGAYMGELFVLAFSDISEEEMETKSIEALTNAVNDNKENLVENEVEIHLDKNENSWIIDMDAELTDAIFGGLYSVSDELF